MTTRPTDDRSQTELAVEMADEWLSSHRKNETWRVVDMVRDELVRTAGRLAEVEALRAERDAALARIEMVGAAAWEIEPNHG